MGNSIIGWPARTHLEFNPKAIISGKAKPWIAFLVYRVGKIITFKLIDKFALSIKIFSVLIIMGSNYNDAELEMACGGRTANCGDV